LEIKENKRGNRPKRKEGQEPPPHSPNPARDSTREDIYQEVDSEEPSLSKEPRGETMTRK
jgi:hypothetical protein